MATTLTINGQERSFDAPPEMPLLWVLRDILGLTGTKFGCGLHRACRWQASAFLCASGRQSQKPHDYHHRRHRRDAGRGQCAEGLARSRSRAMRLLSVWPDHVSGGAARVDAKSRRFRYRRSQPNCVSRWRIDQRESSRSTR